MWSSQKDDSPQERCGQRPESISRTKSSGQSSQTTCETKSSASLSRAIDNRDGQPADNCKKSGMSTTTFSSQTQQSIYKKHAHGDRMESSEQSSAACPRHGEAKQPPAPTEASTKEVNIISGGKSSSLLCQATPKNIADQTCSVCLEQFSEPKILPCGHTFCLKCLERTGTLGNKKVEITCPLCRKTYTVPAGGLQSFLTDLIVSHKVEVLSLKNPSAKNAPVCGECTREGPVLSYCRDCQTYLCKECSTQAHKKFRSYRGHKVIPVQDLDAASLQSSKVHYCSTHNSEVMKLYCETCNKLICRDCTLVDHRQHSYKFVQDARKQINDTLMIGKIMMANKDLPYSRLTWERFRRWRQPLPGIHKI